MPLPALESLRSALKTILLAGVASAPPDDPRLRRAMTAFAPLEKASPVCAKLGNYVRSFQDPEQRDREDFLIRALRLADAIHLVQVPAADPEPSEPVSLLPTGAPDTFIPWSYYQILQLVLTVPDPKNRALLQNIWEEHPEYFRDWRLRPALVDALGSPSKEVAAFARARILEQGPAISSLLTRNFDPAGKKVMVQRVELLERLAGAKANAFYLEQLPQAKGDVRAALIYALRLDPANGKTLVELDATEKGNCRKCVRFALARSDSPEAEAFWAEPEHQEKSLVCAGLSTSAAMSRIVARALEEWLAPWEADPAFQPDEESLALFQKRLALLPGKSGPEIVRVYRHMARLCVRRDGRQEVLQQTGSMVSRALRFSLLYRPTPDLLNLAEELGQTFLEPFTSAAILAALLRRRGEDAWSRGCDLLGRLGAPAPVISQAFASLSWNPQRKQHLYEAVFPDPMAPEKQRRILRPLAAPLDSRWYSTLIRLNRDGSLRQILYNLTPKG